MLLVCGFRKAGGNVKGEDRTWHAMWGGMRGFGGCWCWGGEGEVGECIQEPVLLVWGPLWGTDVRHGARRRGGKTRALQMSGGMSRGAPAAGRGAGRAGHRRNGCRGCGSPHAGLVPSTGQGQRGVQNGTAGVVY